MTARWRKYRFANGRQPETRRVPQRRGLNWGSSTLQPLAIGLKTVPQLLEQSRYHLHARLMASLLQCLDDISLASRRPQQGRLRVTTRRGFDQLLQVREQRRVFLRRLLAASARAPASGGVQGWGRTSFNRMHLCNPPSDDAGRHARRPRCGGDAPVAEGHGLVRDEQPTSSLRQTTLQLEVSRQTLSAPSPQRLLELAKLFEVRCFARE